MRTPSPLSPPIPPHRKSPRMHWKLLANLTFWLAQGALPLGRTGARMARNLLGWTLTLDRRHIRARGWLLMLDGVFARESGDALAAVSLLREASGLIPNNDAVIANLGISLTQAGRYDEAVDTIERALRGGTDIGGEPQIWTALAWAYLRSGRAPKAMEAADRALQSRAMCRDTRLLHQLGDMTARGTTASSELRMLLRACPRMLPLVLSYTQYLAHGGHHPEAKRILRHLPATIEPRAYTVIGRAALNEDDANTTLWAMKELHHLGASATLVPLLRSEVSLRRGQRDQALRQSQEAIALAANNREAAEQLVRVHVVRGEWTEATAAADRAVAAGSPGALSGGVHALHLVEQGQLDAAQRVFHVARTGNALACAVAHVAQALVFARQGAGERTPEIAAAALDYLDSLPPWEAPPELIARCGALLRDALEAAAPHADPEALARVAERLGASGEG